MKKLIFTFIYLVCVLNIANAQEDSRRNREEWLIMELESNSVIRCCKDSVRTLGWLIDAVLGNDESEKVRFSNLRVLKRDELTVIDDGKKIYDYDILAPVKQPKRKEDKDIRFDKRPYSMLVKCNGHDVIIHADKAVGTYGKSYCRNFTIDYPQSLIVDSLEQNVILHVLVTYDYIKPEKINDEITAIVDSVNKKINAKADSTFTDDERCVYLYSYDDPEAMYNEAVELCKKDQRLDANVLLKNADNIITSKMLSGKYDMSEDNFFFASEIKYLIGYNLMETKVGGAFKYLNSASKIIEPQYLIKVEMELINYLVNSESFLAWNFINYHLGNFGENPKKFDDDSDKDFYLFLLRRKGYCLIERQNYKEAKAMFNKVLSYNKDDQMAKSELKYIDECEKKIKEDKKKK